MSLVSCKECGASISSKAETCPQCGLRLRATNQGPGCIAGTFKAVFGLIGALFFMGLAIAFLSGGGSGSGAGKSYSEAMGELRQQCRDLTNSMPDESSRSASYANCIEVGKSIIDQKADELGMAKVE